jgi:capsular exopolysaccharide synthesis family protein
MRYMTLPGPRRRARKKRSEADGLSGSLATVLDPFSPASESYRALRTNLLFTRAGTPPRTIVVTSPGRGEGKSTTCANLGVALAQADKDTLLLDCDFRKPDLHRMFALSNPLGITDVLTGGNSLREVWRELSPGLKLVTSGPTPFNPAELVGSVRFAELLDQACESFDYVLVDAPPLGLVSDAQVLAAQADGVLLVVDARRTSKKAVRESVRSMQGVGAKILGTVVNNIKNGRRYGGDVYPYA